jgi:hypothetical protein
MVPLIVRLKQVKLVGANYEYWKGISDISNDLFSYYKARWILILGIILIVMLIVSLYKNKPDLSSKKYFIITLGVYSLFIVISTIFSQHKGTALFGFTERYEGMFILLIYSVIAFAMMVLADSEKKIKVIFTALFISALIIAIIGLFQYFGRDLWKSDFGKKIMLGSEYEKLKDSLNFLINENKMYSTLYHYNYVGSYMAMLFPLTFTLCILVKNKICKVVMALISLLMLSNVVGSNSRAGVVGVFFAIIFLLIILNKFIKKHWKGFLSGIVVLILITVGLNAASKGTLSTRLKSIVQDAGQMISGKQDNSSEEDKYFLKTIIGEVNRQAIVAKDGIFKIGMQDGNLIFYDENDKALPMDSAVYDQKTNTITFLDERYKDYKVLVRREFKEKNAIVVQRENTMLIFGYTENSIYLLDHMGRKIEDIDNIERWGFEGKEKLGSSRGYIWSRSIPMLKHTMLVGHGPDTFAIYFPQHDMIGKMHAYNGDLRHIVDKPHSLYLQIGINTGVISLIAFLVLVIMYIVSSFKVYFNNTYDDFYSAAGVAIFAAIIGYLGAGFFNDSVVSVAPVFWCLLGMGIGINMKLKSEKAR